MYQRESFFKDQKEETFTVCFSTGDHGEICMDSEAAVRKMVLQMIPWMDYDHEMIQAINSFTEEQRRQFWCTLLMIQRTNLYKLREEQEFCDLVRVPDGFECLSFMNNVCYKYENELFQIQKEEPAFCIYLNNPTRLEEIPYCYASAGKTRDIKMAEMNIEGVSCLCDCDSREYVHEYSFPKDEFNQMINELFGTGQFQFSQIVLLKDNSGYVNSIRLQNHEILETALRRKLKLFSPGFEWREQKDGIHITSYGLGNGYGISLYTVMDLIRQNKTSDEVLLFFFQEAYFKRAV